MPSGKPTPDLTGQRFGRLVVLRRIVFKPRYAHWLCVCDCGQEAIVASSSLTKPIGGTKSCGCLRHRPAHNRTHNQRGHPLYATWAGMIARCEKPTRKEYPNYGGRGISVCERWHDYPSFLEDMAPSWRRGLTLDRKNNDEGYSPDNCRWATKGEQQRNMRTNRWIETPLGSKVVAQAAREFSLAPETIFHRLRKGWPQERLLEPADPKMSRKK